MTVNGNAPEAPAAKPSRKTDKLVRGLDRSLARVADDLVARFGEQTAALMRTEILEEYRRLIPGLPELDPDNPMGQNIRFAPASLAVYRVVLQRGGDVNDYAEVSHRISRAYMQRTPLRQKVVLFEKPARRERQGNNIGPAVAFIPESRRAPRGMITGAVLCLQHKHAGKWRELGSQAGPSHPRSDNRIVK